MAIIESSKFLKTLIQSGPDANLNLFEVSFLPSNSSLYESSFSCRVTTVSNVGSRDSGTTTLPYQNIEIIRVSPSTQINKVVSFTLRVDDEYKIIEKLRSYQCIDESGYYSEDENKQFSKITLRALKPTNRTYSKDNFASIYEWVFKNCYITALSPLTYSYQSATNAEVTVSFVWGDYEEHSVDSIGSSNYVSSSDIVNKAFEFVGNQFNSLMDKLNNK